MTVSKLDSGPKKDDRNVRMATAGLSAIGATAGLGGLAYGARDMVASHRAGKKIPLRAKLLVPLEVAGLGGELMATKILHGDTKRPKPVKGVKPVAGVKAASLGLDPANSSGRRIVEVEKASLKGMLNAARNAVRPPAAPAAAAPSAPLGTAQSRTTRRLADSKARQARPDYQAVRSRQAANQAASNQAAYGGPVAHNSPEDVTRRLEAVARSRQQRLTRTGGVGATEAASASERGAAIRRQRAGQALRAAQFGGMTRGQQIKQIGQETWGGMSRNARIGAVAVPTIGAVGVAGASRGQSSGGYDPYAMYGKSLNAATLTQMSRDFGVGTVVADEKKKRKAAEKALAVQQVGKARRFDAEADRQRRLGLYSGLAGGAGLIAGERALREFGLTRSEAKPEVKARPARNGKPAVAAQAAEPSRVTGVHVKGSRGRAGALVAATGALAGLSGASYARGVSRRNQPWS